MNGRKVKFIKKVTKTVTGIPSVLIYPVNDLAVEFVQAKGKRALTESDLEQIKSIGFELEIVSNFKRYPKYISA